MARWRRAGLAAVMLLAVVGGLGARSLAPGIVVDGRPQDVTPALKLQGGRMIGPIAPLARALGAVVSWDPEAKVAVVRSRSPWVSVDHEPSFGSNPTYDLRSLGPVMAVRHSLSELQWSSLEGWKRPEDSLLVRFEIVDAFTEGAWGIPREGPLADSPTSVSVTAVLYWASLDPEVSLPAMAMRLTRVGGPSGQFRVVLDGPRVHRVRVETVRYLLSPKDNVSSGGASPAAAGTGKADVLVMGASGWSIVQTTALSSYWKQMAEGDGLVPLYDPSVQRLHR